MREVEPQELAHVIDDLICGWDARNRSASETLTTARCYPGRKHNDARAASVLALTAHIYELAERLRPLDPPSLTVSSAPTVRAIYESLLTVVWLHKEPEAIPAWIDKVHHSRTIMRDEMMKSTAFRNSADHILIPPAPVEPPTAEAKRELRVEAQAERISVSGAYAIYRVLCEETHPSAAAINHYLGWHDDTIQFRPKASESPLSTAYLWLACASMLWSARCVDHLDNNRRRSELRAIAKRIEAPADIDFHPRLAVKEAKLRGRESV